MGSPDEVSERARSPFLKYIRSPALLATCCTELNVALLQHATLHCCPAFNPNPCIVVAHRTERCTVVVAGKEVVGNILLPIIGRQLPIFNPCEEALQAMPDFHSCDV